MPRSLQVLRDGLYLFGRAQEQDVCSVRVRLALAAGTDGALDVDSPVIPLASIQASTRSTSTSRPPPTGNSAFGIALSPTVNGFILPRTSQGIELHRQIRQQELTTRQSRRRRPPKNLVLQSCLRRFELHDQLGNVKDVDFSGQV